MLLYDLCTLRSILLIRRKTIHRWRNWHLSNRPTNHVLVCTFGHSTRTTAMQSLYCIHWRLKNTRNSCRREFPNAMPAVLDIGVRCLCVRIRFESMVQTTTARRMLLSVIFELRYVWTNWVKFYAGELNPKKQFSDCTLTTNGSAKLHWLGLQNEALKHLNHSGPYAILEPNRCFAEMVWASLIPQFTDYRDIETVQIEDSDVVCDISENIDTKFEDQRTGNTTTDIIPVGSEEKTYMSSTDYSTKYRFWMSATGRIDKINLDFLSRKNVLTSFGFLRIFI